MMTRNHYTLTRIRNADPNGGSYEPSDADMRRFYNWITENYGADMLEQYLSNWDTPTDW